MLGVWGRREDPAALRQRHFHLTPGSGLSLYIGHSMLCPWLCHHSTWARPPRLGPPQSGLDLEKLHLVVPGHHVLPASLFCGGYASKGEASQRLRRNSQKAGAWNEEVSSASFVLRAKVGKKCDESRGPRVSYESPDSFHLLWKTRSCSPQSSLSGLVGNGDQRLWKHLGDLHVAFKQSGQMCLVNFIFKSVASSNTNAATSS